MLGKVGAFSVRLNTNNITSIQLNISQFSVVGYLQNELHNKYFTTEMRIAQAALL